MDIKYTEFNTSTLPVGTPSFHTPELFREYVNLYWSLRKFQNLDIQVTGGFAPFPALQPSVDLGQGTTL